MITESEKQLSDHRIFSELEAPAVRNKRVHKALLHKGVALLSVCYSLVNVCTVLSAEDNIMDT